MRYWNIRAIATLQEADEKEKIPSIEGVMNFTVMAEDLELALKLAKELATEVYEIVSVDETFPPE